MRIFNKLKDWTDFRQSLSGSAGIGFVPTMGNLHAGHLSLLATSRQENSLSVTSLFVNPLQFNKPDDFENYPRTLEADLELLESAGTDYCLLPEKDDIYPDNYRYRIQEEQLGQLMEGASRPGHFTGVLSVVMKLLNLVQPTITYFGEKDYQQYLLIRDMAQAFFLQSVIRVCPTVREADGLACSSRNNRLSTSQRQLAGKFARIFHQDKSCETIIQELEEEGIPVDYLLEHQDRRYAAVLIGEVRLIDNYRVEPLAKLKKH